MARLNGPRGAKMAPIIIHDDGDDSHCDDVVPSSCSSSTGKNNNMKTKTKKKEKRNILQSTTQTPNSRQQKQRQQRQQRNDNKLTTSTSTSTSTFTSAYTNTSTSTQPSPTDTSIPHSAPRRRHHLGHRHTNSLLLPLPATTARYDGSTQGRGLEDVENAPLPEQLEEYKYGGGNGTREERGGRGSARAAGVTGSRERVSKVELERGKYSDWRGGEGDVGDSEEEGDEGGKETMGRGMERGKGKRRQMERESNSSDDDEFDSLDDFIVGDDEDISYFEEDSELAGASGGESEEEEEELLFTKQKPRSSPRKLFRGITPKSSLRNQNNNVAGGRKGNNNTSVSVFGGSSRPDLLPLQSTILSEDESGGDVDSGLRKFDLKPTLLSNSSSKSPKKRLGKGKDSGCLDMSDMQASLPDPDSKPQPPPNTEKRVTITTPPSSPSKPRLGSPSKNKNRIPPSPHRPSIDAFWSQEVINEWNDQYSPRKMSTPGRRGIHRFLMDSDSEETSPLSSSSPSPSSSPTKRSTTKRSPTKSPTKSSLAAAAAAEKRAAAAKKREFDEQKVALAEDFLKVLDDSVTGGEVQRLAAPTGGVKIVWSNKLNTTAGRANWKREAAVRKGGVTSSFGLLQEKGKQVVVIGDDNDNAKSTSSTSSGNDSNKPTTTPPPPPPTSSLPLPTAILLAPIRHHATIELASKIIDTRPRLLNTLAHEYCHLTNFMISNVRNNPHGTSFKTWAAKCESALEGHALYGGGQVKVTTRHSYEINWRYLWCCERCGCEYGRHSKSIDTGKSRCGREGCKGVLVQVRPKPRGKGKGKEREKEVEGVQVGIGRVGLELGL
ncbi:hypothetical protein FQN50_007238 [Emmonsiellopsis sp. PD_5]|nr:hypothetical protein FQN50_007238 [Emmonsiellopsis sp. PD_5]